MFVFGTASQARLATVHPELRAAAVQALEWQIYDFTIVCGFRNEAAQEQAFLTRASTKRWPYSQHNVVGADGEPKSEAFDFAPWCQLPDGSMGIPWEDTHAFAIVGGIILAAGAFLGVRLRWGADWDMDGITTDQSLMDYGHVERAV